MEPKTLKVKLNVPHTHAGTQHAAGSVIDLPETKALWLCGLTFPAKLADGTDAPVKAAELVKE